jgi:hypothetical protein
MEDYAFESLVAVISLAHQHGHQHFGRLLWDCEHLSLSNMLLSLLLWSISWNWHYPQVI